mgnify:CR=1 FL=1
MNKSAKKWNWVSKTHYINVNKGIERFFCDIQISKAVILTDIWQKQKHVMPWVDECVREGVSE